MTELRPTPRYDDLYFQEIAKMDDEETAHNETLEFLRVCKICEQSAVEDGRLRFVNRRGSGFVVSGDYNNDWLFRAYPGGRKVLSVAGKKLAGVQ